MLGPPAIARHERAGISQGRRLTNNKIAHYSIIPIVPARHRSRSGEAGGSEAN